jgi:hypothetical protein
LARGAAGRSFEAEYAQGYALYLGYSTRSPLLEEVKKVMTLENKTQQFDMTKSGKEISIASLRGEGCYRKGEDGER